VNFDTMISMLLLFEIVQHICDMLNFNSEDIAFLR